MKVKHLFLLFAIISLCMAEENPANSEDSVDANVQDTGNDELFAASNDYTVGYQNIGGQSFNSDQGSSIGNGKGKGNAGKGKGKGNQAKGNQGKGNQGKGNQGKGNSGSSGVNSYSQNSGQSGYSGNTGGKIISGNIIDRTLNLDRTPNVDINYDSSIRSSNRDVPDSNDYSVVYNQRVASSNLRGDSSRSDGSNNGFDRSNTQNYDTSYSTRQNIDSGSGSRYQQPISVPTSRTVSTSTSTSISTNSNLVFVGLYQIIEYQNQIPGASEFIEFDDDYAYLPNCNDARAPYKLVRSGDSYSFSCNSFDFDTSSCSPMLTQVSKILRVTVSIVIGTESVIFQDNNGGIVMIAIKVTNRNVNNVNVNTNQNTNFISTNLNSNTNTNFIPQNTNLNVNYIPQSTNLNTYNIPQNTNLNVNYVPQNNLNTNYIPQNTNYNTGTRKIIQIVPIKKRTYSSVNYTPVYTYQGTTGLTYNDLLKNLASLLVTYKVSPTTNLGTLGTIARQGSTQNFDLTNIAQHSNFGSLTNLGNLGIIGYGSQGSYGGKLGGILGGSSGQNLNQNLGSSYSQSTSGSTLDLGSTSP